MVESVVPSASFHDDPSSPGSCFVPRNFGQRTFRPFCPIRLLFADFLFLITFLRLAPCARLSRLSVSFRARVNVSYPIDPLL